MMELKQELVELKQETANLKLENANLKQEMSELKNTYAKKSEVMILSRPSGNPPVSGGVINQTQPSFDVRSPVTCNPGSDTGPIPPHTSPSEFLHSFNLIDSDIYLLDRHLNE